MHASTADAQAQTGSPRTPNIVNLTPRLALAAFEMTFSTNEEIFAEEETADFVYKVISGAVRTTRLLSDGRRQIVDFHLEGDVFGLELGSTHRFSAEAIGETRLALVRRSVLLRAVDEDRSAARELWMLTSRELEGLQDHMLLLGRKSASERVASFLLRLSGHAKSDNIDLPMSRGDIADHLGLTLETVSRTLSQFSRDGLIELPSARRVEVKRSLALAA